MFIRGIWKWFTFDLQPQKRYAIFNQVSIFHKKRAKRSGNFKRIYYSKCYCKTKDGIITLKANFFFIIKSIHDS